MKQSNRKIKYMIIGFALLLIGLVGVTYGFFNYTRTGNLNNLGTGRIYFNSEQNGSISMTNVFPMTSSEAINANLDTVTVDIVGDTTYANGEEFEITLVDVKNTINGKKVPIRYIATYTPTTGNSIGVESDTYWESRESKNADIYTLTETGNVKEGKQVLVGFIKNSATGINGTLTIKAYVDANEIAITDTYPSGRKYEVNHNMSSEELNDCVSYLTSLRWDELLEDGETLNAFCLGTGTVSGLTFQYAIDYEAFTETQIAYLIDHNLIKYLGENRTTEEWVNGRTVFTTEEWNSLQGNNALSFKIRVESNEGIWVVNPMSLDVLCPDCVFTYSTTGFWTTWNTNSQTPSVLTSSDYSENYEDVIATTGKNYFLGLKLNDSNQIEKAYACGLYNNETPFCIEGYYDNSKNELNKEILQDDSLWDNACEVSGISITETTICEPPLDSGVRVEMSSVDVSVSGSRSGCIVEGTGEVSCGAVQSQ